MAYTEGLSTIETIKLRGVLYTYAHALCIDKKHFVKWLIEKQLHQRMQLITNAWCLRKCSTTENRKANKHRINNGETIM